MAQIIPIQCVTYINRTVSDFAYTASAVPDKIATEITQRCFIVCNGAKTNNSNPIKKA